MPSVDVETICREGLCDVLLLDCLCTSAGGYIQDVRPYLEKLAEHSAFFRAELARAPVAGV